MLPNPPVLFIFQSKALLVYIYICTCAQHPAHMSCSRAPSWPEQIWWVRNTAFLIEEPKYICMVHSPIRISSHLQRWQCSCVKCWANFIEIFTKAHPKLFFCKWKKRMTWFDNFRSLPVHAARKILANHKNILLFCCSFFPCWTNISSSIKWSKIK